MSAPWPEFAEYDCFACHHDLTGRARDVAARKAGQVPGSLRWGTWPYTNALRGDSPADLKASLARLGAALEKPLPARLQVAELAGRALHEVDTWLLQANGASWNVASRRERMAALASAQPVQKTWDASAQAYYGLAALAREPTLRPILDEMARTLAFPIDPTRGSGWESPRQFEFKPYDDQLARFRKELEQQK